MFRSPDEQAMIDAALARATAAYASLDALTRQVAMKNAQRAMSGARPVPLGSYNAPSMPQAPGARAGDLVQMLDGQAQWFAAEAERLRAELAEDSHTPPANATRALAPAPRPVPTILALAELTRTPWRWLRWILFPPFTMLLGVAVGALSLRSPEAAGGGLLGALALVWAVGFYTGLQRIGLLARGEVPVVLQREERVFLTRNSNVPMLQARGWTVSLEWFSGRTRGTTFTVQTSRARVGRVAVTYGPPFDGMLLVDPETAEGCAHMDLASVPVPDERGQWRAALPTRVWLGMLGGVVISSALACLAVATLTGFRIAR